MVVCSEQIHNKKKEAKMKYIHTGMSAAKSPGLSMLHMNNTYSNTFHAAIQTDK